MSVLYVISDRQTASTALELASKESGDVSILLIGPARGLLDDKEHSRTLDNADRIFCLGDTENESSQIERVEVVDYSGWVELIEENERIISWT